MYYNNAYNNNYGGGNSLDVDLTGVDYWDANATGPVPAGEYRVFVDKAELRTSQKGNRYLAATYRICEGSYMKRCFFDNFAMWCENNNSALQRFKSLRRALSLNPNEGGTLEDLLGKEFVAVVKTRESTRNSAEPGERENYVTGYKPVAMMAQQQAPIQQVQAPQAAPAQQRPAMQQAPQQRPAAPRPQAAPQAPRGPQAAPQQQPWPSEYAQAMANGPEPQEAFPTEPF